MASPVIELTGSLRIRTAQTTIDAVSLTGRRAGVALARLAVDAGNTVSRDALADALWGERPPASWRPALRNEIAAIRAVLAAPELEGTMIVRAIGDGYRLELPADAIVDLIALSTVVAGAETALRTGELERANELATGALDTASRTVLAGASGDWIESLRAGVEELRQRAQRCAGEAGLALGDFGLAETMAHALIAADPVREDSHRLLMLALRAGGNIGAALSAFEACRRRLAEDLGTYPSDETQSLFMDILGSSDGASVNEGSPLSGRRGAAPSQLLLVGHQRGFTGHEALLHRLEATLEAAREPRFIALTGVPGSGKTTVAARLAAHAHGAGLGVLYGAAARGLTVPYAPFITALDTYFSAFDARQTVLALGAHGETLGRLLPSLGGVDGEGDPVWVAEALAHATRIAANGRGALLVLDDMQWSGDESLAVLERIAETGAPILVVVLHRRTARPALLNLEGMEHLVLEPDEVTTRRQLREFQRFGSAIDRRFTRAPRVATRPGTDEMVATIAHVLGQLRNAGDPVPDARLDLEFLLRDALTLTDSSSMTQ